MIIYVYLSCVHTENGWEIPRNWLFLMVFPWLSHIDLELHQPPIAAPEIDFSSAAFNMALATSCSNWLEASRVRDESRALPGKKHGETMGKTKLSVGRWRKRHLFGENLGNCVQNVVKWGKTRPHDYL